MSINKLIITALVPTGWLVVPDTKEADTNRYFVFNYSSVGDIFADDTPYYERYLIQVHLFCPCEENTIDLRRQTKRLLFEAGFTFPLVVDSKDEDVQHWIFECEKEMLVYG